MAYNPYIVVPFATWAVAQVAKFALAAMRGRVDLRYLYASGGMPSVHSAVVCALATTALLVDGIDSPIFGLSVIFAAIVMYDSFGVRRSSGEQAAAINMLVESLDKGKVRLTQPDLHLREILGHQPKEVTVGAIVGIGLAGLFNYDRLGAITSLAQVTPVKMELWLYAGIFALIVVGGWIAALVLRARYRKSPTMRTLRSKILVATQTIGWVGLGTVALQYEHAMYLSWRLWAILVLAVGLVWAVVLVSENVRSVPAALRLEATEARKRKWFTFGSRRRAHR